jgi:aminoglycoside phosphotransferase (APT) family kinase protein
MRALPDGKLPFIRTAWSPADMTRVLNEEVLPQLRTDQRLLTVRRERMTYWPERECVMLYALLVEPATAGAGVSLPPFAVVSLSADGRYEDIYRRHYCLLSDDGRPTSAVFLRGHEALVELFPLDWGLPGLAAATDMQRMTPLLSDVTGSGEGAGVRWTCDVLRYHPAARCVLRYTPTDARVPSVVGKLYARSGKSARAWEALRRLADAGVFAGAWQVPAPLAHVPETNLVLMGDAPGRPLRDLLSERADGRIEARLRSAASLLAALHRLPGEGLALCTVEDEGADVLKRAREVAVVAPALARRITALQRAISGRLTGLIADRSGFLHGCFTPNQLLVDGDRIALIDFDAACCGDPAIDVGQFVASMHKYGTKMHERKTMERLTHVFLRQYEQDSPGAGIVERAGLIACQELLRYASRSFLRTAYRYDDLDRADRPSRFVDAAEASLAKL